MDSFDYIVVGAGSAGCVIASGLSARYSVLLLEAGGRNRGLKVAIPAAFAKNFKTDRDWGFQSEPEGSANGRSLFLPSGRGLGGSSSINAMIYMRGRPSDYDRWEAMGAEEWGWSDVLPVFRAMESNGRFDDEYHGSQGSLRVEDLRSPNPFSRRFIEAALESGIGANADFNGATQEGVGYFQVTQRRGRRWSAADAYLRPAMSRPTLKVITDSHCLSVILQNGRAVGVEYAIGASLQRAFAEAEVVLSAGSYGSPHILELSGVGDPDHLRTAGIQVKAESPHVGAHLKDHPIIGIIQRATVGGTLDDAESIGELAKWMLLRRGRLTSNVAEAGAFVKSAGEVAEPDLEFHFGPVFFDNHGMTPLDGHAFSLGPMLLHPTSEGTVHARDGDATTPPEIRGNYLADDGEVTSLIRGIRLAREIVARSPFDAVRGEEMQPGPQFTTDLDLRRFTKERFELLYHPIGTCRMGKEGVVDSRLAVRGVSGLRVADASVMPATISGNTNAAAMMIGQKAVQMILNQPANGKIS